MDKRELQIWQPVTCLVKGNVVTAKLEHSVIGDTHGLRLELTDIDGNVVQIVYDKISPTMRDYIWTYRYVNEIKRCDLNKLIDKADHTKLVDPSAHHFYKMVNSDLIEWYDQLPWLGSEEEPNVEHHIYMYNDGVFEIVSIMNRGLLLS
jgi:hypothetical protein